MSTEEGTHGRYLAGRLGAALIRMSEGPERPLAHLDGVYHVRAMLDLVEGALVEAALKSGASYGEIGRRLGISRQAARQAHVKRTRPDDMFGRWMEVKKAGDNRPERRFTVVR